MGKARHYISPLALLAAVTACDSRVGSAYQGTSLLHLEGRVVIADANVPDDLVPALAFPSKQGMTFVDVQVHGDFPNNFSLDVFAPPPDSAIATHQLESLLPEGAEVAVAYIAALPRQHVSTFVTANKQQVLDKDSLPACAADPACDHVEKWCTDTLGCRTVGLPRCESNSCMPLYSEGNDAIHLDETEAFAGLSESHILVWTRTGLSDSSLFSHLFGIKEDLPPGYSLVEIGMQRKHSSYDTDQCVSGSACEDGPSSPAPTAANCQGEDCGAVFLDEAFARYNAQHGTAFRSIGDIPSDSEDAYDAIHDEVWNLALQLAVEHGVDISEYPDAQVIHDAQAKLTVRIAHDVQLAF
ncbi:MAG: hypothetical protein JWN04_3054 [Myxococcaceae bacterium]|nr:hypothetical protein [Myxococcaceae bacterium]